MRKSTFTESQIVAILKEGEARVSIDELTRKQDQPRDLLQLTRQVQRRVGLGAEEDEGA